MYTRKLLLVNPPGGSALWLPASSGPLRGIAKVSRLLKVVEINSCESDMSFRAKCAAIQRRSVCGDKFADTGTQRRGFPQKSLAETCQVNRHLRLEREQVPNLHILGACGLHRKDQVGIPTRLRIILDAGEKRWFH